MKQKLACRAGHIDTVVAEVPRWFGAADLERPAVHQSKEWQSDPIMAASPLQQLPQGRVLAMVTAQDTAHGRGGAHTHSVWAQPVLPGQYKRVLETNGLVHLFVDSWQPDKQT